MAHINIDRRRAIACVGGATLALLGGTMLGCTSNSTTSTESSSAEISGSSSSSQPDPDVPTNKFSFISEALTSGPSIWFCSNGDTIDESTPINSIRVVEDSHMTTYIFPTDGKTLGDFASMSDPEIIDLARTTHIDNLKAEIEDAKAQARDAVGTGQVDPILQKRADTLVSTLDSLVPSDPEPQTFVLSADVDDTGAVARETLDVAVQSLTPLPDINSTDGSWETLLDGLAVTYDEHITSVFSATDTSQTETSGGVTYAGYPALFAIASKSYGGLMLDEADSSGPIALS